METANLERGRVPELPEVETIRRGLEAKILGATITGVESDWPKTVREPNFLQLASEIRGQKILAVTRRGKLMLLTLSSGQTLVVHLRMTGHLIVSEHAKIKDGKWLVRDLDSPLNDPANQFIHLILTLNGDRVVALSDLRKFANVRLVGPERLNEILSELGPEPLSDDFTLERLAERLEGRKTAIKKLLMDQKLVAGVGNIYADEILFQAGVRPTRSASDLKKKELKAIYLALREVLAKAIAFRGTSVSDFRDADGRKGDYQNIRWVYFRHGEPCLKCGTTIEKIKVGNRGTHFCPSCQAR